MSEQQQSELDRLWSALDSANAAIHSLEMLVAKRGRQHAPTPDYRIGEPVKLVFDEVGADGPCSCEEAVALRAEVDRLRTAEGVANSEANAAYRRLGTGDTPITAVRELLAEAYALPNRAKLREHAWRYLDMIRDELAEPTAFEPAAPRVDGKSNPA